MVPLARRYLFSDRIRLAIAAGGVTIAVLLIVLVQALYQGLIDQVGELAEAAPSDLWVMQAGTPDPGHGASILPNSVLSDLQEVPGVAAAQPLIGRAIQIGSARYGFVMAVPEGPFQALTIEAFGVPSVPEREQVILSDVLAKDIGAGRGDAVLIGESRFEVVDVSSSLVGYFGGAAFVNAQDARQLFGEPEAFSFALVAASPELIWRRLPPLSRIRCRGARPLPRTSLPPCYGRSWRKGFFPS